MSSNKRLVVSRPKTVDDPLSLLDYIQLPSLPKGDSALAELAAAAAAAAASATAAATTDTCASTAAAVATITDDKASAVAPVTETIAEEPALQSPPTLYHKGEGEVSPEKKKKAHSKGKNRPTLTADEIAALKEASHLRRPPPRPPKYRSNVAAHFINEHGQVLACFRVNGRGWGTVQGGVEDDDETENVTTEEKKEEDTKDRRVKEGGADDDSPVNMYVPPIPTRGRPYDPTLLRAALREVEEEIGLSPEVLQRLGCEYLCTVEPPSRREMEALLLVQRSNANKSAQNQQLHVKRPHPSARDTKVATLLLDNNDNNSNHPCNATSGKGDQPRREPSSGDALTQTQTNTNNKLTNTNTNTNTCTGALSQSELEVRQLELLENDPYRFFTYEFPSPPLGQDAPTERRRRHLGQRQAQLVFFLPSTALSHVRLVPPSPPPTLKKETEKEEEEHNEGEKAQSRPCAKSKGPTQEFQAVAWMLPHHFVPLCTPFKQSIMAYVLLSGAGGKGNACVGGSEVSDSNSLVPLESVVWKCVRPYLV